MGTRRVVSSPRVPRLGPYSQAIRVDKTVYVSGQLGINPKSGKPEGDTFASQARQAITNLQAILEDSGTNLGSVVKVTCFLTEADNIKKLDEVFAEYFPESPPVRSTPIVQLRPGCLLSIDAIAIAD